MPASIFVNKSDRIEVSVYYSINSDTGEVTIVNIGEKPADGFSYNSITAKFRKPDFEDTQRIMQSSTVFEDGTPIIDILRAGKAIMYHLIDSWDVKDEKDQPVPCTLSSINSLNPAIGNALSAGVQAKIGNLGQMFS